MKTLTEFIAKKHQKGYKYRPESKEELIKNIKVELEEGNCDLNCIDTSKITDMSDIFDQRYVIKLTDSQLLTLDVSKWDVSNVKNMAHLFDGCKNFNQDLSKWNTSKVEDMTGMFLCCKSFNQDLSKWDVSKVTTMKYMFEKCENFNQDLSSWDVSNVKFMLNTFYYCPALSKKPSWYKG